MKKKNEKKVVTISSLETLAFWLSAPLIIATSLMAILTHQNTDAYGENGRTGMWVLIGLSVILMIMMFWCAVKKNYKVMYPALCILLGTFGIPFMFTQNGGFYSGMPLFLLATTILCLLCSSNTWRLITFSTAQIANGFVFYLAATNKITHLDFDSNYFNFDVIITYVMSAAIMFCIFNGYLKKAKRFESGTKVLTNYVDERIVGELIDQKEQGTERMPGKLAKVTVLFADIHNFTGIAEKMKPEKVAEYVNVFLEICDEAVNQNHGIMDKYIGDCAMAYWVDEDGRGSCAEDAVRAVLQIREKVDENKANIFNEFDADLDFTAGLCYGNVIIGDMGSNRRREYTIMGDTVNTASRIQGVAHVGHILMPEQMAHMLKDKVAFRKIDKTIEVKGKKKELVLYKVVDFKDN